MTLFWLLCACLTALALAFVLLPLWRKTPAPGVEANVINLQVIRQQLVELEQDLATGALDETQYQSARRDLEKELLLDYAEEPRPRVGGRSKPWIAAVIGLSLPVLAFAMYHQLGNPDIISRSAGGTTTAPTSMEHSNAQLPSMDQLVERLAQRLAQQPDNLEGWMMLGRSYLALGRMEDAINAYGQAYKLAPGNVETLLAYAQSLGMAQGNRLQGRPAELIAQAEKISPEDPNVLWLAGVARVEQADYTAALASWEKVLAALEPGSDDATEVSSAINDARSRLGLGLEPAPRSVEAGVQTQGTVATSPPTQPETANPGAITLYVRLAPELQGKVVPSDRVFIYARAFNGPRMPLAAQSHQVSDLPLKITLDDSHAMTAQFKLSLSPQVSVGARIAKSGSATPQSGDLEAEVGPLVPGRGDIVELVIDKIRP